MSIKKYVIMMIVGVLALQPLQVFALSEGDMEEYSQNNITFYDPSECQSTTNAICTAPTGDQITWIGDSYSVQAKDKILAAFPGVDLGAEQVGNAVSPYTYIQGSKHIEMNASEGSGGAGGVAILTDIVNAGNLRPYLVFALGTNDPVSASVMKSTLEKVAELVGSGTKVILVTSYTTSGADYSGGNSAKEEFANEHDNFYLADWAAVAQPSYYASDSIHPTSNGGYDAWLSVIKAALPQNCTAGLLAGNTTEERIWNYFVQAGIEGVSDNPAVIAGIMGNFYTESGYNPFMRGSNLKYRGLWMLMDSYNGVKYALNMAEEVNAAVGKDYWAFYGWWGSTGEVDSDLQKVGASQNDIDTAIRIELDYLTKSEQNKSTWDDFVNNISKISSNTPSGYSDLFLVKVERAVNGSSPITDPDVLKMVSNRYYQGSASRRNAAEDVYARLSNMTTAPAASAGADSSSATAAVSNGGFTRYALTDLQVWDAAEVAKMTEAARQDDGETSEAADDTVEEFKRRLSDLVNQYEVRSGVSGYSGEGLMAYLKMDGELYVNNAKDVEISSEYLEAARDVLINGNRTTGAVTQVQEVRQTVSEQCVIEGEGYAGPSGDDIAKAAVEMAWPVQTGQGNDVYAGQCLNENGEWVAWNYDEGTCFHNPRDLYRQQKSIFNIGGDYYEDCGWFAATVFYYAEVDDNGGMPKGGTGNMMTFMEKSDRWDEVSNEGSENNLRPGDVFVSNHHISIYVGQYGGTYGKQVHASAHERVGTITTYVANNTGSRYVDSEGESFRIFRRVNNSIGEGGLTFEQAKIFMMNYGANKNGSSAAAVAKDGSSWKLSGCNGGGGSNCVTFSAFFINKFTDSIRGRGNGNRTASGMLNVEGKGTEPRVWAIFSGGTDSHPHTGVILGYHDGEWIVGHASCSGSGSGAGNGGDGTYRGRGNGAGFVLKSSNLCTALLGYCPANFAYPKNVDVDAIEAYLDTGE
ncbi:hypothetical protein IKG64_01145 [Candidatus Saccharibacteria bacterium]|nr:hypothetical protein [Candidatus Saccharibacteria bacterium]